MTALMIVLAMSIGLVVPKLLIDGLGDRSTPTTSLDAAKHASVR